MTEVYDKIKGHAVAQSDADLRCLITGNPCGTDTWEKHSACKCVNCQTWLAALAQSDAEPDEDKPLGFRTNDVPDPYAEEPQTLRDAADNLLLAIGMGWDLYGCVENLRAALTRSDAEPVRVVHDDAFGWGVLLNGKPVKCLFNSKEETVAWLCAALAQSDAPRPDASAGQNIQRYMRDDIDGDTRTPEQKQPGPKYVPIGGAGNGA
jgi:hypothetical protein